ncbi:MAG: zinc-dependent alcohol dehydrogenase [Acetobacteraceae bacterium]
MKASLVRAKGVIECIETSEPEFPAGSVLIRTLHASLCGSDLHHLYTPFGAGNEHARPGAPGHEAVGVVIESRAEAYRAGQLVLTTPEVGRAACFAEYQVLSPEFLLPLPAGTPPEQLVLAQPLGTVIFGLKHLMPAVVPETAVVLGQGCIGLFFTWLLKRAGVGQVIASDLEAARCTLSRRLGADLALDGGDGRLLDAVRDQTRGRGAPLVIEAAGADGSRIQALHAAAEGGMVGFFGLPTSAAMDGFPAAALFRKKLTIRAVHGTQAEPGLASFREALGLIESGAIDVTPLLTHRFALEQIGAAFAAARERRDGLLKTAIHFDQVKDADFGSGAGDDARRPFASQAAPAAPIASATIIS